VGVGAVVVRDSSVLLVRRRHEPAKDLWSLPGGLIELGETAQDAVRREVMEETGINIQVERLLDVVDNIIRDDQGEIRFHYVLVEFLAEPITFVAKPQSDARDVKWVPFTDLASYPMTKTAKKLVEGIFKSRL
jgi:mutator protein MutT